MIWLLLVPLGLLLGHALFGRPAVLAPAAPVDPLAPVLPRRVRIVVPCRDEEASIGHLLTSLEGAAPEVEVVVVDDHSTDATASIVERSHVASLVRAPPLPDGWCGKPWACTVGAAAGEPLGDRDVLVFLDADVTLAPGAVSALLAERDRVGGVVSVQPYHVVPTATEQLSALFNLVSIMGIGAGTDAPTGMFGPVVCCTAGDYRRVGGHGAVRGEVVEDLALARAFRAHDVPVRVLSGGPMIRFRMYPRGMRSLVEGWTKNMSTGASATGALRLAGVAAWICALVVAPTLPFRGLGTVGTLLGLACYGASVESLGAMLRRVGSFRWWTPVLFPVAVAFFCLVFVRSVWRTRVRHSVEWRGRRIQVTGA